MAALFLSCVETASPGSQEVFFATDPEETVEPAPTVDLRQVAEAASADLQVDVIEGEELVYSRVTASTSDDDPTAVTVETGGLDDAVHQRAARPWTHLDETEPYVYRSAGGLEKREDGTLVRTERVYRRPNLSPRREVPVFEPPFVDEKLRRELAAIDDPEAMVRVHLKARHAPRYDKPLRPRAGASPAEVLQVESARERWETDRESRIRAFLEPVLQELETLDGTGMQVLGTNGWVGVSLPLASVELLLEDERFAAVVSPDKTYRNNSCIPSCNDSSHPSVGMSNEWYLGDGHELARLGSLKFLQQGYDGSFPGSLRHDYGSLVAGIAELGAYEDDGLFDNVNYSTWRIFEKYRCRRFCDAFLVPCIDDPDEQCCSTGYWNYECNQQSNLQDAEGADCGNLDNDEGNPYGCHGTPVSSILLSNYKVSSVESGPYALGDDCFNSAVDNSHCDSFYDKTRGMAPGAKGIFYWLENADFLGYRFARFDEVDVLNLSHGADTDRCILFSEGIEFDELEDAFDDGVFVVNSTGNFKYDDYMDGFRRNLTQNDCLLNEASTKPKVFSVGGIYNRVYNYSSYSLQYPNPPGGILMDAWELTNASSTYQSTASLHPIDADDYRNQRLDPLGSQTGGRDLTIKNESGVSVEYPRAMTGVDLLAPRGGWRATSADGVMGEADEFFSGSSGAAPHLSGLSLLVKHWLLAVFPNGWSWNINDPGNLHVVMLLMGDRSVFSESTLKMNYKTTGGDMMYGFGRVRVRLLGSSESELSRMEFFDDTFANNDDFPSIGYMGRMLFATPAPATTTFVKVVMMQVEDMDGKSTTDMVSDFQLDLYITNGTYATTCPSSFEATCGTPDANGNTPYCTRRSDTSHDVKKMIAYEALAGSNFQGKCFFKRIKKRRITPQGVTLKFAYYRSQVPDWASSSGHTCAVRSEGFLDRYAYCWGNNDQGQLGDGTTNYRFSPVSVVGGGPGSVNQISAGGGHTCATYGIGGASSCWGRNDHGQLGRGTTDNSKIPVGTGLNNVAVISAGSLHTCAVKSDNTLWCWGSNRFGQLGTGDVSDRLVPTQIAVGTGFSSVSAGKHHTCALGSNSKIYCWGLNDRRQSGAASGEVVLVPQQVGSMNFNQVSSGSVHSCGVTTTNNTYCWGDNRFGQFGLGVVGTLSDTPILVPSFNNVASVHAGGIGTCARKTDGSVWCWGDNRYGQLGIGNVTNNYSPQQLTALGSVNSVSVGKNHHSCAVKTDGTVSCWGQNDNGQLGRNYISKYSNYVSAVTSLTSVLVVSSGN